MPRRLPPQPLLGLQELREPLRSLRLAGLGCLTVTWTEVSFHQPKHIFIPFMYSSHLQARNKVGSLKESQLANLVDDSGNLGVQCFGGLVSP